MRNTAVVCHPADAPVGAAGIELDLARLLSDRGFEVLIAPELYHLVDDSEAWRQLAELPGSVAVFCRLHPRAARWLMHRHAVGQQGLHVVNLQEHATAAAALDALQADAPDRQAGAEPPGPMLHLAGTVTARWYPVVDQSRCSNCHHCLQFCIFGVYRADDDGRLTVSAPDNCKPGCPACARICPNSAIMFPLYDADEAIAGAPDKLVTPDDAARRMYYARTGALCPRCGLSGTGRSGDKPRGTPCAECGRVVSAENGTGAGGSSEVLEEIDALFQELEDLSGGGG